MGWEIVAAVGLVLGVVALVLGVAWLGGWRPAPPGASGAPSPSPPLPPPVPLAEVVSGVIAVVGLAVVLTAMAVALAWPPLWLGIMVGLATPIVATLRGARSFVAWWAVGLIAPVVSVLFALLVAPPRDVSAIADSSTSGRDREGADIDGDELDPFDEPAVRGYPSWIAGIAHRDSAARHRLAQCRQGEALVLTRDPFNAIDPRAVEYSTEDGVFVGYVPTRHVGWVCDAMDAGRPVTAEIETIDVRGGEAVRALVRVFTT